jgi:hypothetical protein
MNPLDAGRAALARGDWPAARLAFDAALQVEETPEALEGLGLAAWWLDLADVVFDVRERAYRRYRERDDGLGAARMAVWLAWDTAAFRGEQAIANGWLQRAHRLLEGRPDAIEHAWLALRSGIFALLDDGDPDEADSFLQVKTTSESSPSCDTVPRFGFTNVIQLKHASKTVDCVHMEETINVKENDSVVYWRFYKGGFPNVLIVDDISISAIGCTKNASDPR